MMKGCEETMRAFVLAARPRRLEPAPRTLGGQADADHLRRTMDEVQRALKEGLEQSLTVIDGVDETGSADVGPGGPGEEAILRRRLALVTAQLRDRTQVSSSLPRMRPRQRSG